jgi:hypothetical protein
MAYLFPDDHIDIFLMDCPRQTQYHLNYTFLEDCLNGKIFSEKYECCEKKFDPPHVFVFMNRYPKFGTSILSEDRYVIFEVGLTPEERVSLNQAREKVQSPFITNLLPRTKEIMKEAKQVKSEKRALIDGRSYIDNGILLL